MKATFERAADGQVVIRLAPQNPDEELLLDGFKKEAGAKAWVYEDIPGSIRLSPKEVT